MSAKKAKRTVTRLRFTEEERGSPEQKPSIKKIDKASEKLDKAVKKTKVESLGTVEKTVAMDSVKKTVKLQFEDLQMKKTPSTLTSVAAALPAAEFHRQVGHSEDDNVGVESAHRLESTAEVTVRTAQNAHRSHTLKHQRKALKAEKRLDKANISYLQKNAVKEQPGFATNPLSRWQTMVLLQDFPEGLRILGLAWLISPFGLPLIAAFLVELLGIFNDSIKAI